MNSDQNEVASGVKDHLDMEDKEVDDHNANLGEADAEMDDE